MSNRVLEFIVRAKDKTFAGLQAAGSGFQKFRDSVSRNATNLAKSLFGLKSGMLSLTAVVGGFGYALRTAFEFERYETQFKVLFGSLEQAKRHMADLQEFSASTPFQFADIAQASRQLHVFTGGAMGAADSMKLVGDAAAAIGAPLQEVGMWVGRAYAAIKGGRPWGEAAMRLSELGVLTPEVRAEMEEMAAAGAANIDVWQKLQSELQRFNGGMEELSKTGEGLFSTLKDNWKLAVAEFGKAFMDVAKNDITLLTDKLKELRENGDIAVWALKANRVLNGVKDVAQLVGKGIGGLVEAVQWAARMAGALQARYEAEGGGGFNPFKNARAAVRMLRNQGGLSGVLSTAMTATHDVKSQENAEEEVARQASKDRQKADAEDTAATKQTMDERIAEDMAASQKKIDEQAAKDKAVKEKAERENIEQEIAREQARQMRELMAEEKRLRREMNREQTDAARKVLSIAQDQKSSASDRLTRARSASAQAWGWYRDPESFKAQLAEERADAGAQTQFEKDAKRLRSKFQWRTRDLGDNEEAVRRVILAREEEAKAQRALTEIAAHTRDLATKLDTLLQTKG